MMIVSPTPVFRWTDNNGNPAVGWQVETYIAGSSTPVDTYTDATGTAENTNPIILDARGEANIWLDPAISYKYVIKNSLGVVQDTIDQIQAGSGGSGGLTRVYYNDSSSIAFSGLGTLATPLSSAVKLSAYPNNALQIRPDGLYAMAIGGGGSVAWGSITGNILAQTDLINKFGEYLPLTFASAQTLTYTGESTYQFLSDGRFSVTDIASGNELRLDALNSAVLFKNNTLQVPSGIALRTWELPDASGTIALTSQIPSIPVTSVFGRTGAVTAQSGDYTTAQVTESGNLYFTEARVRSTALTGLSATNSAIVATDSVLVGFNKAQGQINAREPSITAGTTAQYWRGDKTWQTLNTTAVTEGTNLYFTEARVRSSVLTGFSVGANSAIVATDSVLQAFGKTQGQINALVTADGTFIKRDGTSTTTATIPFALGINVDGKSTFFAGVTQTGWVGFDSGAFNVVSVGIPLTLTSPDVINYNATTHHVLKWNGTTTPPTGTQTYLLGIDANGRIIQGSAGSGFVTISGHNDLTTPWSIGDASTWGTSSAGIQIDPVGSYGLYLKGNTIIEQAVSQALSLYRPVASGDVCLNFDAWDSLGAQSSYAQVCGVVVSNTAGSVGGGLDLEVAIAGVLTPLLQLRQAGSTLTGSLTASGNISVETNASDIGFYSRASGSAGTIGGVYVGRGQRGTLASPTATQSGDGLLWLGGQGYGDTGFSAGSRGVIRVRASENWTDLAQGAYISFETTATGGTTRAERGRIENNGVLTWLNRIDTTASTTTTAGIRIPHGTAPSAPVNGELWSTTTAWLVRTNGATQTIAMLENAQTFSGVKTFSATPVISSTTSSTTAGAIYRTASVGLIGYEFGMAQRLQSTIYRAPVGTALTNSVTETDVNGGTAVFGTRTLSNSAMQIGAVVLVFARIKYTNTAANTLTLRLRWSTIAGTILATAVLTRVNAGAEVFDLVFRGIAQVAPSATSATSWSCDVQGQSLIATNATTTSTEATLATSTATPLILSAQWTLALATSSVQVLNSYISVE